MSDLKKHLLDIGFTEIPQHYFSVSDCGNIITCQPASLSKMVGWSNGKRIVIDLTLDDITIWHGDKLSLVTNSRWPEYQVFEWIEAVFGN